MAFLRAESWKRGSGLMATNYHPSIYIVCRYGVHIESRSNIPILVKEPPNLEIAILPPIRLIISFDALMWDESPRVRLYTVIIVFFFFFSMYRCQADHIRYVTYKPTHFDFICIPRHRAIYENHPTMNNHHEGMPRTSSRIWNSPFHQGWLSPHSRICDVSLDWPPYRKELDLGLWTFLEDRICVIGLVTSWLPCMYSPYSAAPDSVAVAESPAWALILLQKALHILAAIGCIISGT